jgi:predicted ATP-binding protein involved in virulence
LHLPVPELKAAVSHFFERMNEVVAALEKTAKQSKKKRMMAGQDFFDWIINKPQADRILEHIKLLDEYALDRSALHEPIDRFISLVNGFLQQTKKRLNVDARGEVHVFVENYDAPRPITALSSGERQLLVMLAHLSLNKNLAGSGVFIVDEPELSLHIDWQERFVDAIREANPSVQLIMATHSPAIILDRVNRCKTLS